MSSLPDGGLWKEKVENTDQLLQRLRVLVSTELGEKRNGVSAKYSKQ